MNSLLTSAHSQEERVKEHPSPRSDIHWLIQQEQQSIDEILRTSPKEIQKIIITLQAELEKVIQQRDIAIGEKNAAIRERDIALACESHARSQLKAVTTAMHNSIKNAMLDPLTQLKNRRAFDTDFERIVNGKKQFSNVSIVAIDIDNFKKINDSFWHTKGDEILKIFASILQDNSRKFDNVYRIGWEEFIILLDDVDIQGAQIFSEKMRKCIENYQLDKDVWSITASFWIASTQDKVSQQFLVEKADKALYKAKNSWRNCICIAEE